MCIIFIVVGVKSGRSFPPHFTHVIPLFKLHLYRCPSGPPSVGLGMHHDRQGWSNARHLTFEPG